MKIKEVIAKTGLTDRAIRLYIENGLVTPENEKSYNGRNNYNFTQADIERFEQIAILRKADFSLEQIKTIKSGGESAKEVLIAYLNDKKESVVTGQKIVDALKDIPQQEIVTIDYVCEKIKDSFEQTPLPDAGKQQCKHRQSHKNIGRQIRCFTFPVNRIPHRHQTHGCAGSKEELMVIRNAANELCKVGIAFFKVKKV